MVKDRGTAWWQQAVFYQIYPHSFADGNGDGTGDLAGILDRLDYLADLGIDAIWLSPHYPSPQFDCGYDIADYMDVNPEYGTMADFQRFLDEAHRRNIRVILDLVLNHTSDQHPWFLESCSDRDNPRRNWYIWRDGCNGDAPNDWISTFGGPAWTFDPRTDQYYYHYFFRQQPDLNWRNPAVKKAMFGVVRYWLDMGVDGFRLDAIGTIFEDPLMPHHNTGLTLVDLRRMADEAQSDAERDRASEQWNRVFKAQVGRPEVHDLMKELRALVDEYDDRVLVGETDDLAYYGEGTDELDLVFNFPLKESGRLTADLVRTNQAERLEGIPSGGWPCNTLGNHDSPRVYSHFGDGVNDDALARLLLGLVLTLKGTPFLYYGEEIGMVDFYLADSSLLRDQLGIWLYRALQEEQNLTPEEALVIAVHNSRDRCRTPMQWSGGANAGFCPPHIKPWLPVHPNHRIGVNVAEQEQDPDSLLHYYRSILRMRRETPALRVGDYVPLSCNDKQLLVFLRHTQEDACLVIVNWTRTARSLISCDDLTERGRVRFGTHREAGCELEPADLRIAPFELLIADVPIHVLLDVM